MKRRSPASRARPASPPAPRGRRERQPRPEHLVKLSVLARLSEVPAATIKHYVREGLVPGPSESGRNVAFYDRTLVDRIRRIKELQRSRFLPLKVIREVLDGEALPSKDDAIGTAIARVLSERPQTESRSEKELVLAGMPKAELGWLMDLGLVTPVEEGEELRFSGDDLELLRVLGAARRVGITADMLPVTVLGEYAEAMRRLVRAELRMFREGVLPRGGEQLESLATAATTLSERLVVLLRRKLLLPTLQEIVREELAASASAARSATSPPSRSARKKKP